MSYSCYRRCAAFVLIIAIAALQIQGVTLTVSKDGSGNYTSIQAAISAAAHGDVILIRDLSIYNEQVTIDSTKDSIILRSYNPTSTVKPVIQYQDKLNVGPKNCTDAKDPSKVTYDKNGALRLINVRNVTIDGIAVDGGGAYPFAYPGIWECKNPLFHGNVALLVNHSGNIVIRNCEISNSYFGIYLNDSNEGGIYASANPSDIKLWNTIPATSFSKTGCNLFEKNRVHDNSWGMFFESLWNTGSTIRYNLFYENHHASDAFASQVKALPDGQYQPGGALFFKDVPLSPLGIYNNTFWHNFLIFAGHWQASAQHQVFNNIYAQPYRYWNNDPNFPSSFQALDICFTNKMHNCIYSSQAEKPIQIVQELLDTVYDPNDKKNIINSSLVTGISKVGIMNGMDQIEFGQDVIITIPLSNRDTFITKHVVENFITPGALITKPFPKEADIRWLEMTFKSTDPSSPDFLVPNWDDFIVKKYVVNQGWTEAGIMNANGPIADLGALPFNEIPSASINVRPKWPVVVSGANALSIMFNVFTSPGISNLKIKYLKWINLDYQANTFGGSAKPVPLSYIISVEKPLNVLQAGSNSLNLTIPNLDTSSIFGFFEMVIEGETAGGNKVASEVGFLPYRKLGTAHFKVELWDTNMVGKLSEIKTRQAAMVKITPVMDGVDSAFFNKTIKPVEISLTSCFELRSANTGKKLIIDSINSTYTSIVYFTRIPPGEYDNIAVNGVYNGGPEPVAFSGISDQIRILPDAIHIYTKILFTSDQIINISSGKKTSFQIILVDEFGNFIKYVEDSLSFKNLYPSVGTIDNPVPDVTDSNGVFPLNVTALGAKGDTIKIEVTLKNNQVKDTLEFFISDGSPIISRKSISQLSKKVDAELVDLRGRIIRNVQCSLSANMGSLENALNMKQLPRGLYIIRVREVGKTGVIMNRRILK